MNNLSMLTLAPIPNWTPSDTIYGVIIRLAKADSNKVVGFKITTDCREICNSVNKPNPGYNFNAFTTIYDAEVWLCSQLSFEEQFAFHLFDGERVVIGEWYIKEEPS